MVRAAGSTVPVWQRDSSLWQCPVPPSQGTGTASPPWDEGRACARQPRHQRAGPEPNWALCCLSAVTAIAPSLEPSQLCPQGPCHLYQEDLFKLMRPQEAPGSIAARVGNYSGPQPWSPAPQASWWAGVRGREVTVPVEAMSMGGCQAGGGRAGLNPPSAALASPAAVAVAAERCWRAGAAAEVQEAVQLLGMPAHTAPVPMALPVAALLGCCRHVGHVGTQGGHEVVAQAGTALLGGKHW